MARMIKNTKKQIITCNIITSFEDGSTSTKLLNVGDIVENLRYVSGNEVATVTGKIINFKYSIPSITNVDLSNPVDYFAEDVYINSITMDCSREYESNIVTIPVQEIVEDDGVVNVNRVYSTESVKVTMDMLYTDGSIVNQDIEVGDVLTNFVAMSGTPKTPDITGDYRISAFIYKSNNGTPVITGLYLTSLDGGNAIKVPFENIISFVEKDAAYITSSSSLAEITNAFANSGSGEVYAQLSTDVTIPPREDGRITTTSINSGQTLNLDLNGKSINTSAYAFYVNGGILNITDSDGSGKISCGIADKTYPAIFVTNNGECNMYSGVIDTTNIELNDGEYNWEYGISVFGDSTFNMYGGEIKTAAASAIATTNGQGGAIGSNFTIAGDSVISSEDSAAVYLPDQRSVTVKDNAKVVGGIIARMGHITIQDNAIVESQPSKDNAEGLGFQVTFSGVCKPESALLALTGIYNSVAGNEMNIVVKDNAKLIGKLDNTLEVAKIDTLYDQVVNIDIKAVKNIVPNSIKVYENEELRSLATAAGRTLAAKSKNTDLTIKVAGSKVYPV